MSDVPLLRTSERSAWTQCRQRWHWSYVDCLKPKSEVPALRFGDLVHQALAAYYIPGRKRGPAPAEVFERLYNDQIAEHKREGFDVWADDAWQEAGDLGVSMLERYVERWKDEDSRYMVIQSEMQFRFPLRERTGGPILAIYVGTIDGLWKDLTKAKRPFLFAEHKTTAAISLDGLPLDEQAGAYWTYGPAYMSRTGRFTDVQDIDCVLYNFLRKAKPNPEKTYDAEGRVLNKDGSVSKVQPAPYFAREPVFRGSADRRNVHRRVLQQLTEIQGAREGRVAVYKIPGPLHNPNCRGCPFRDMCELHETGNDWRSMAKIMYEGWDPYDAHELESGERR
jgi:hypothetical protein